MLKTAPVGDGKIGNQIVERYKKDVTFLLLHMSQIDICKIMRMDKGHFLHYRTGKRPLTQKFINRFYTALQGDLDRLLMDEFGAVRVVSVLTGIGDTTIVPDKGKAAIPDTEGTVASKVEEKKQVYSTLQQILDEKLAVVMSELTAISASQLRQEEALKRLEKGQDKAPESSSGEGENP